MMLVIYSFLLEQLFIALFFVCKRLFHVKKGVSLKFTCKYNKLCQRILQEMEALNKECQNVNEMLETVEIELDPAELNWQKGLLSFRKPRF
jgi:hypothetical protein